VNKNTMSTQIDPSSKGTVYCLLSATCYSGTNICLRQLAEIKADPAWVICLKETTAVLIIGPWLLWQLSRGVRPTGQRRALLLLFIASLTVQLVGNLSVQWALGIVGLAISLPIVFSTSLIGSAVIGSIVFHESLSTRSALAIIVVIFSIVLLSLGATELNGTSASTSNLFLTSLAIVAVSVSGIILIIVGIGLFGQPQVQHPDTILNDT
jgi:drug/metabolite transporter (DMT)-like permease